MKTSILVAGVLALAACGGKSSAPATTPTPAALPDVPFAKLDHAQQAEFMKQKVVPAMQPIFQKHDPKKYAAFGCETCHGEHPEARHFDMPNAALPALGYEKEFYARFKPTDLEWMGGEVLPAMAKLLGETPSFTDPAPTAGFGCAGCHPMDPTQKRP